MLLWRRKLKINEILTVWMGKIGLLSYSKGKSTPEQNLHESQYGNCRFFNSVRFQCFAVKIRLWEVGLEKILNFDT